MSHFVSGRFTFDEPPCYCKADPEQTPWNWGINTDVNGRHGLYIECPRCKAKAFVTNNDFRCGVRFSKEKHYDTVDDCKIIPFRKRR